MPASRDYRPSTSHADLGGDFFDVVAPAQFPQTILRYRNKRWAERVGLEALSDEEWLRHFGRFQPLPGSFDRPLALRYHGHQFRSYNPDLGDGRGFLFAQLHDGQDGRLLDLATKGSGQTPWSRHADGRLTLKGGVREVLATEMLEALGVDTSKSFSLIETGEELERNDEPSPTRAAVLVRLSHSHIRIGTFQRLRYLDLPDQIETLLDHTVRAYMPEVWRDDLGERAAAFLHEVCQRVARTGAAWMLAGFVHGVLNTDNVNVTGESFDYGPWRFLPTLDPGFTAAYFDQTGLYAYGRQPEALAWNLTRLAECLLPLAQQSALEQALATFEPSLHAQFGRALRRRLGVQSRGEQADTSLIQSLWDFLAQSGAPFEQTLFDWHGGPAGAKRAMAGPNRAAYASAAFQDAHTALMDAVPTPGLRLDDPYFGRAVPCTMLIDEVEAIWAPIALRDDWTTFERKLADVRAMGRAYGAAAEG